jgi:peroxiredoxin
MRKFLFLPFAATLALAAEPAPTPPAIGAKVADFGAKNVDGRRVSLSDFRTKKATIVVFIGTECKVSNLYLLTLAEMHRKYADKSVQILAINSNDYDTYAEVVAHAKERPVPFPILKDDDDHSAAAALSALRTPEAFLLDSERVIRYHGRIDDQYGVTYARSSPSKTELKNAVEELLAGKPIAVPQSEVSGCRIGRSRKSTSSPLK